MKESAIHSRQPGVARLRRLERVYIRNPIYFLTLCTAGRSPCLARTEIHSEFTQFCDKALERGVMVGRYVIMPDHLHLFLTFAGSSVGDHSVESRGPDHPLSRWVKSLKNSLSKILRELGVASPHWQKGFFDHVLRSEESYAERWMYVAMNPVRAGFVGEAREWVYSGEICILSHTRD